MRLSQATLSFYSLLTALTEQGVQFNEAHCDAITSKNNCKRHSFDHFYGLLDSLFTSLSRFVLALEKVDRYTLKAIGVNAEELPNKIQQYSLEINQLIWVAVAADRLPIERFESLDSEQDDQLLIFIANTINEQVPFTEDQFQVFVDNLEEIILGTLSQTAKISAI